jgi:hypothetical protein
MFLLTTVNNLLTWRWPNTAETCRHRRSNKLRYLDSCVFDGPTHHHLPYCVAWSEGFRFCNLFFLVLCHYRLENRVIRKGVLVIYVLFCSGSIGNLLFFYGGHVFPFVCDMWHVRSVSSCHALRLNGCSYLHLFLVDQHLLCWNERTCTLNRSTPILWGLG